MFFSLFSGNIWIDILFFAGIIFSIFAQIRVNTAYNKYSKIANSIGLTGLNAAYQLKGHFAMDYLNINKVPGSLSDHYNPKDKSLGLSEGVADNSSIASLAIVAHEMGHARQDAEKMVILKIRNSVFPVANIASNAAIPLFIIGLLFSLPIFMDIGIILFALVSGFYLLTLPLEINASSRGIKMLREGNYLNEGEIKGAKAVLSAAALTYIAALASALITLFRLLVLRSRN